MNTPLVRWLLLLLLAFDLASSPFHAHRHDTGPGEAPLHLLEAAGGEADLDAPHDHRAHSVGHSLTALRSPQPDLPAPMGDSPALADAFRPAAPRTLAVARARPAPTLGGRSPHDGHLRPDGRAPPLLHA